MRNGVVVHLFLGFATIGSVAASFVALGATATTEAGGEVTEAIRILHDDAFIGALTKDEITLGQVAADAIRPMISGDDTPCESDDPMRGILVASGVGKQSGGNVPELASPLRQLSSILEKGSPAQRAVATYAAGRIGRRASPLVKQLEGTPSSRDSWAVEALEHITCEQWSGGGWNTVHIAVMPADHATWLIDQALNNERVWPSSFFTTAWSEIANADRSRQQATISIRPESVAQVANAVVDSHRDSALRKSLLELSASLGEQARPIAEAAKTLVGDKDRKLARAAEVVIVSARIPAAVDVFHRWLLEEHMFNLGWAQYVDGLSRYADELAPIFAEELTDPIFTNRAAAAHALGELHAEASIPVLLKAITSADWLTAQAAVGSLGQFAPKHPDVDGKLQEVAKSYWSGRVRAVADVARRRGVGIDGDPFACGNSPDEVLDQQVAAKSEENGGGCIVVSNGGPIDHKLPTCVDGTIRSSKFVTAQGNASRIRWEHQYEKGLPRNLKPGDISSWCGATHPYAPVLRLHDGWLVGCSGFEEEGMLAFVSRDGLAKPKPLLRMGVTAIVEVNSHIYVAGSSPFEFDSAGALYELTRVSSSWGAKAIAALPSVPTEVAVVGKKIAFKDDLGAVLFDPADGISALKCEDANR